LVFLVIGIIGKIFSIYRDSYKEKALILIYISSAISVIFSGDFITLYIFWEIMAISSSLVIFSSPSDRAYLSGFRYLLIHLFGGLILLIGIIGLSMNTNNLEIRLLDLDAWYNWLILKIGRAHV
jgi:multicomponent Na+:H+ antiporter subunit D